MVIGTTFTNIPRNIFDGISTGVDLNMTEDVVISHNEFRNLKAGVVSYPELIFSFPQDVKIGINKNNFDNIFNNCYYGIISESTETIILNNFFDAGFRAITIANLDYKTLNNIKRNEIFDFEEAIHIYNVENITLNIDNNHLHYGMIGMKIDNSINGTNINGTNTIAIDNNVISKYFSRGIDISNHHKIEITNNELFNNYVGIELENANYCRIVNNTVTNYGISLSVGIGLVQSMGNYLQCNTIDKVEHCLYFKGICPSKLYYNTFGNAKNGITLDFAEIGQQGSSGGSLTPDNEWVGSGYGPLFTDNKHTLCINGSDGNLSPFFTRIGAPFEPEFNDVSLPSLNPIPYTAFNNPAWPINPCNLPMPSLMDTTINLDVILAVSVVNMPTTNFSQTASLWLKKEGVYSSLKEDTVTVLGTQLQNFKDSISFTDMGELEQIKKDIKEKDLVVAKTRNDNLMPSNDIEFTYKDVYTVLIRSLIEERTAAELTADELDTLQYIAYLCPFTHGRSVYTARAICSYLDTVFVSYFNPCEAYYSSNSSSRLSSSQVTTATIDIHPNPTKDVVYITTNLGDDETGILHIIDSKGQSVLESTIENNAELMLNVGNLNAGLYVVRISDTNGRLLHSEKLTIFGR